MNKRTKRFFAVLLALALVMSGFSGFGTNAVHADEQQEVQTGDNGTTEWEKFCTFWSEQPASSSADEWSSFCQRLFEYYYNHDYLVPDEANYNAWYVFCDQLSKYANWCSGWKDMWLGFGSDTDHSVTFNNFEESLINRQFKLPLYTDKKYEPLAKKWEDFCNYWKDQPASPNDIEWTKFCSNLEQYTVFFSEASEDDKKVWHDFCHGLSSVSGYLDNWESLWDDNRDMFPALMKGIIFIDWDQFSKDMQEKPLYTDSRKLINIWKLKEGDWVESNEGFYSLYEMNQQNEGFSVISAGFCGYNCEGISGYNLIEVDDETEAESARKIKNQIASVATDGFLTVLNGISTFAFPSGKTEIEGEIIDTSEEGILYLSGNHTSIEINSNQKCYLYDLDTNAHDYKNGAHKAESWLSMKDNCLFRVESAKKLYADIDGDDDLEIVNYIKLKRHNHTFNTIAGENYMGMECTCPEGTCPLAGKDAKLQITLVPMQYDNYLYNIVLENRITTGEHSKSVVQNIEDVKSKVIESIVSQYKRMPTNVLSVMGLIMNSEEYISLRIPALEFSDGSKTEWVGAYDEMLPEMTSLADNLVKESSISIFKDDGTPVQFNYISFSMEVFEKCSGLSEEDSGKTPEELAGIIASQMTQSCDFSAGKYYFEVYVDDNNIMTVPFEIVKKPLLAEADWGISAVKIYDGTNKYKLTKDDIEYKEGINLNYAFGDAPVKNSEGQIITPAKVEIYYEQSYLLLDGSDVGEHKIAGTDVKFKGEKAENYYIEAPEASGCTILPAPITIKLNDVSMTLGDTVPEFTYTVTEGQLFGDDKLKLNFNMGNMPFDSQVITIPEEYIIMGVVDPDDLTNKNYDITLENDYLNLQVASKNVEENQTEETKTEETKTEETKTEKTKTEETKTEETKTEETKTEETKTEEKKTEETKKEDNNGSSSSYVIPSAVVVDTAKSSGSDVPKSDVDDPSASAGKEDDKKDDNQTSASVSAATKKIMNKAEKAAQKVFGSAVNTEVTVSSPSSATQGTKTAEKTYTDSDGKTLKNTFVKNKKGIVYVDGNGDTAKNTIVVYVDPETNEKKEYYTNKYGYPVKNKIVKVDDKKVYAGADGVLIKNEMIEVNNKTYIADSKGFLATNKVVKFDGKRYYANAKSVILKNRLITDKKGKMYYASETGALVEKEWITIGEAKYYFGANAVLKKIKMK